MVASSLRIRLTMTLLLLMYLGVFGARPGHAIPVFGELFDDRQPDGTAVQLRVWGDEYFTIVESLDGYTLVRQPDGWICYAMLSADGRELLTTGIRLDPAGAPRKLTAAGIGPHVRIAREAVEETVEREKTRILGPAYKTALYKTAVSQAVTTGSAKGLTLLIDFPDVAGTIPVADLENMLNQIGYTGYSNNGSVRDYFRDVSKGQLDYVNTVTPAYYRALNPKAYYDNTTDPYGSKARELIKEALNWLESQGFDFAPYDTDGDGTIDAINAFYAGNCSSPWSKGLWPHSGSGLALTLDGKQANRYQISNIGTSLSIGTFCHENGHMLLGLPDLYDYGYESAGMGNYCLMASGGSKSPRQLCAYMKVRTKWARCIDLTAPAAGLTITANSLVYYRYPHPSKTSEYFLVDCLHKSTLRDSSLPDQGLAVWHIDTSGSNNNEQRAPNQHYLVSLEQADGRWDLERNKNSGDNRDLYDASQTKEFSPFTNPDSRWWDGSQSNLYIHDIGPTSTTMKFSFGDSGAMTMAPAAGLAAKGLEGSSTAPTSQTYTLYNLGTTTLNWTTSASAAWFAATPPSGSLAAGTSATLRVEFTPAAQALPPGSWRGVFMVKDRASSAELRRLVALDVARKGLAATWNLDDSTGTVARDTSGGGFDGTVRKDVQWTGTGRWRGGVQLKKMTSSCIDVPALNLYSKTVTLSAWIKRSGDQASSAGILSWRGTPTIAGIFLHSGNKLGYRWNNVPNTYNFNPGLTVPDETWCFVAVAVEPERATLYLHDGTELRSAVNPVAHDIEEFTNTGRIGWDTYDSTRLFKGEVDEVRIYNYALNAGEVAALRAVGGRAENPTPAHWATGVAPKPTLRWLPAPGATAHRVYLGISRSAVESAGPASAEHLGTVTGPSFNPGPILGGVTYFWRVDEVGADGSVAPGLVWRFSTAGGPPPAPRAHWKLDETSGTIVHDAVGTRDAKTSGSMAWAAAGRYEGCAQFNGSTAFIDAPSLGASLTSATMCAWIKLNGNADDRDCILGFKNGSNSHGLYIRSGNELGYSWNNMSSSSDFISRLTLPVGKWCFVALAVEPAGATLYTYDGTGWATARNAVTHGAAPFTSRGQFGHDSAGGSDKRWFKGWIDDVRVYDGALMDEEIVRAAQSRMAPPGQASVPLPAHGATGAAGSVTPLSWTAGNGAELHDVYFGHSWPPAYQGTWPAESFYPGAIGGSYYWRVDEVNSGGVTPGVTWHFTTAAQESAAGADWAIYE